MQIVWREVGVMLQNSRVVKPLALPFYKSGDSVPRATNAGLAAANAGRFFNPTSG
jgi:hypothetical protein